MDVLVTSGSWSGPSTIMHSLAQKGHRVSLMDEERFCAAFYSRFCNGSFVVPKESREEDYVNAVVDIVRTQKFDLLIPAGDFSTEFLSKHRGRILPFVRMFLPPPEAVDLARFKDKTYRFAIDNNIDIPTTFFPADLRDVDRIAHDVGFPCVVKEARGTANMGNTYINSKRELIQHFERLGLGQWPVIQEFVKGDFYGFMGVAYEGEIVDCLMFKARQEEAMAGTAPYCVSIDDEEFLATAKRIIKAMGWSGALNMDFLKGPNREFRLLEVNPRFPGSLYFAYKLGIDLPSVYFSLALGRPVPKFKRIHYKPGVHFRFVLPVELNFVLQRKSSLFKFLVNFFNFRMKSDIPWNDPALIVWKLKHMWWKYVPQPV